MLGIGVDLGGTKIEAVVIRARSEQPEVLARRRAATHREEGYQAIIARTQAIVADVTREAGTGDDLPIGVGMPGGITFRREDGARATEALVKNSNTTCLNGRPFHADLERALGRRIAFANDANCFALAEATWGAAREARVAFGVILGTGVGGGIAMRAAGKTWIWEGAQGIAGEWGHVSLDPVTGGACYCGRKGCVETYLAGPAIEAAYRSRTGVSRDLREIGKLADAGDSAATALLSERIEAFGRALAIVVNVLDPDVIVLGGGVSNVAGFEILGPAALAKWVFNDELRTRLVRHELGDSAGVYGAALMALGDPAKPVI
jgi:fructokinase